MTSTAPQSLTDEFSVSPLARIDAQDEGYVLPLREYLEANGCAVVINTPDLRPVTYHIAAGDLKFVKSIFASAVNGHYRRLGIILGSSLSDAENCANGTTKIITADPVYLSAQDVIDIFTFFFAGIETLYDKRRKGHEPAPIDAPPAKPKSVTAAAAPRGTQLPPEVPILRPENKKNVTPESDELRETADRERIGTIISDVFRDSILAKKTTKKKFSKRLKNTLRQSMGLMLGCLFIILIPLLWYAGSLALTAVSFSLASQQIKSGKTSMPMRSMTFGTYWLSQSKLSFSFIKIPFVAAGTFTPIRGQERVLSFFSDIADTYQDLISISEQGKELTAQFLPDSQNTDRRSTAPAIEKLRITAEAAHNRFGLAEAELATLLRDQPFPFGLPWVRKHADSALTTLRSARELFTYVNNLLLLYPRLAGFTHPSTYLVLLQNSNELRPTGGFIGSIGVVRFEDGSLSDFSIQDVYALDGQLKGHVDPPKPIRDLLSQEHWYLRDSNWAPDFKDSGERAQWFYEKETGVHVDGVIAVNVPVIVDVLKATGPVTLPDYNDRITADNFFGKSFYYTQNNFFPGSTQKKDFLGTLSRALLTKIMTDSAVSETALFSAFKSGVQKRDITFLFDDHELQELVEHFGWGGRLFTDAGCSGYDAQYCLYDPAGFSEANVSVSKVNYFIQRDAVREISFDPDGGVTESLSLTVKNTVNTSPDGQTPGIGGPYKTYIRFLLPADSLVNDVRIDDRVIASRRSDDRSPVTLPYIESADGPAGVLSIGVALVVAPGIQNKLQITYKRKHSLPFGKGGSILDAQWYKHPGINSLPLKTIIHYPLYWVATDELTDSAGGKRVPGSPSASGASVFIAKDGQLEYNNDIQTDQSIQIKFIK